MDATEKRIRRIVYTHGGGIYDATKNQIISEFTCTKRAKACCQALGKLGKKVRASRAGNRVMATIVGAK